MKEKRFIEQNRTKWEELEELLKSERKDPDRLSDLFVQVTDDLSYARTHYGNRVVRVYLNQLTQNVFGKLYRNTTNQRRLFIRFWKLDLPVALYQARKELRLSLILFSISFLIGVVSSWYDPDFAASILGDSYIDATNANIASGDPMAVYKDEYALEMFFRIALNNIVIGLRTFLTGLLFAVGSVGVIIYNGIMVGVFQFFFVQRGLFVESALTIWMHGAFEISAIVISGGAGLLLGKGLVFPGTYTRLQSLRIAARSGIRIMILVVAMLLVAAIIESFITRFTSMPDILRFILIVLMFGLVLFYTIVYPKKVSGNNPGIILDENYLPASKAFDPQLDQVKSSGELFGITFQFYFKIFGNILLISSIVSLVLVVLYMLFEYDEMSYYSIVSANVFYLKSVLWISEDSPMRIPVFAGMLSTLSTVIFIQWKKLLGYTLPFSQIGKKFVLIFFLYLILCSSLLAGKAGYFTFFIGLPFVNLAASALFVLDSPADKAISEGFRLLQNGFNSLAGLYLSLLILSVMMLLMGDFLPQLLQVEFIEMLFETDYSMFSKYRISLVLFFHLLSVAGVCCLLMCGTILLFYSLQERQSGKGLRAKLVKFGLADEE